MHSCRRTSANFYVPAEPTALLYKEWAEFLRRPRGQQPAASPAPRNLATEECGASS
jgi:hypothetical protein